MNPVQYITLYKMTSQEVISHTKIILSRTLVNKKGWWEATHLRHVCVYLRCPRDVSRDDYRHFNNRSYFNNFSYCFISFLWKSSVTLSS